MVKAFAETQEHETGLMEYASSLEVRQTRVLAMTPQLRQAIGLLQFNNAELLRFLEGEARKNPLIEVRTQSGSGGKRAPDDRHRIGLPPTGASPGAGQDIADFVAAPGDSLAEHILRQIGLSIHEPGQERISIAFLEALEPYGWLGAPVSDVAESCGCSVSEAEDVLAVLQTFEPAGIFARSLAECLRLQAADQGLLDDVMSGLIAHLDLVAGGDLTALADACDCEIEEIATRLEVLRRFDPKPGTRYQRAPEALRPPDIVLSRDGTGWTVALNATTLPEIHINERGLPESDRREALLAEAMASARGLQRAIEQRNVNTLAVAAEIVRLQSAFFCRDESTPLPMSMKDVGDAVSLHESTVSRIIAGMTMETPSGVKELRSLFVRGLARTTGDKAVSVSAVRTRISDVVRRETPDRPLSDAKIVEILRREGIVIQRRTVAKYRGELGILSSAARRRAAAARNP